MNSLQNSEKSLTGDCLLDNSGIFMGYTSLPISEDLEFYDKEISKLFIKYRNAILENNKSKKELLRFFKKYYIPHAYYIFGQYDLGVISLVDDYSFAIRNFIPFHPSILDNPISSLHGFTHQAQVVPIPKFSKEDSVIDLVSNIFSDENKAKFPLISINQLKLSSALLMSYGIDYLRAVIKMIHSELKEGKKTGKYHYLILESHSWHEITLIITSNSYKTLIEKSLDIREFTIEKLRERLETYPESNIFKRPSIIQKILNESKDTEVNDDSLYHVFAKSQTTLGFNFDIFREVKGDKKYAGILNNIKINDDIYPFSRWFLRGGSFSSASDKILKEFNSKNDYLVSFGRGDLVCPMVSKPMHTREYIKKLIKVRLNIDLKDKAIAVYTVPSLPPVSTSSIKSSNSVSPSIAHNLKKLMIEGDTIIKLKNNLKYLGVSKIVNQSFINLFSIYNQSITEPLLYLHFIDLKPFVEYITNYVENARKRFEYENKKKQILQSKEHLTDLYSLLENCIFEFQHAYANRSYSSYLTWEVSDSNLYFKGGIHQLITAYDGLVKALSGMCGSGNRCAFIAGEPNLSMSSWTLRLNVFHIFSPELLASTIGSELSMDFIISQLDNSIIDYERYTKFDNNSASNIKNSLVQWKKTSKNDDDFEFIPYLVPEFFSHVIADLVSYHFIYLNNHELYSYWTWNYFASTRKVYETPGKIEEKKYLHFLLRQLCVLKVMDSDDGYNNIYVNYCPELEVLTKKHLAKAKEFINRFLGESELGEWLRDIANEIRKRFVFIYGEDINQFPNELANEVEIVITRFKEGKTVCYEPSTKEHRFQHACLIMYSYLILLKLWYDEDGKKYTVLKRVRGKPNFKNNSRYARFLFDPLGGVFIKDLAVRKDYFKYRSVFILSLVDMALKSKGEYLLNTVLDKKGRKAK